MNDLVRQREPITQAVILAGGKGQRLRPMTDDRPKCMVEVAGIPIIEWQLRWLEANGITDVVVSIGYKADTLVRFLSRSSTPLAVTFAYEDEPLGRGGGLRYAARSLSHHGDPFLAMNGDVITDLEVAPMWERHQRAGAAATLAVVPHRTTWGVVYIDSDEETHVVAFEQSPVLPYWINAGVYIMEWPVTARLPVKGDHEDTTLPDLARNRDLVAHQFTGFWKGIDTLKDVTEASVVLGKRQVR
jgi:NDP-sugar pyrophosphorylase family protein